MADFRFEDMEIWNDSINLSDILLDYADRAEKRNHYRFAEQLRGATMSISNNIAEGSGSFSKNEFAQFLNYSRRSIFECANITVIFQRKKIISNDEKKDAFKKLKLLSQKITNFRKSILK
jgi:four helix bundle protein